MKYYEAKILLHNSNEKYQGPVWTIHLLLLSWSSTNWLTSNKYYLFRLIHSLLYWLLISTESSSPDILWRAEQYVGVSQRLNSSSWRHRASGSGSAGAPERAGHEGESVETVRPPVAGVGFVVLRVQARVVAVPLRAGVGDGGAHG